MLRKSAVNYDDTRTLLLAILSLVVVVGVPNEMTPMAWKMPNPEGMRRTFVPRYSSGTWGPSDTTVKTMMTILTNASADAFASLVISL